MCARALAERHARRRQCLQFLRPWIATDEMAVVVDLLGDGGQPDKGRRFADVRRARKLELAHRVTRAPQGCGRSLDRRADLFDGQHAARRLQGHADVQFGWRCRDGGGEGLRRAGQSIA